MDYEFFKSKRQKEILHSAGQLYYQICVIRRTRYWRCIYCKRGVDGEKTSKCQGLLFVIYYVYYLFSI